MELIINSNLMKEIEKFFKTKHLYYYDVVYDDLNRSYIAYTDGEVNVAALVSDKNHFTFVTGKLKNQKFNIDVDSGIVIVRRENENSLTKIIFRTYYCADNFFYYNFFPIINAEEVVTLVKLEGSEWNL